MDRTIKEILEQLATEGRVIIHGFGTFTTAVKKGREGVSFGKPYKTEDKVVVKFTQSDSLDSSAFTVKE